MTDHLIVLLACLAVIAVLAVLVLQYSRSYAAALSVICDLRVMIEQVLAANRNLEQKIHLQGHVLFDAHKRICAVSKGLEKRPS